MRGHYYVWFGFPPSKARTRHPKFNTSENIHAYGIFQTFCKTPAGSVLETVSLPKQVMVMRRYRQLWTNLSRWHLESVPLNEKTELIQKGSSASHSGMEKRKTAATQTSARRSLCLDRADLGFKRAKRFFVWHGAPS